MGQNVEEIALVARDEASTAIRRIAGELGGMGEALVRLSGLSNPVALGIAAIGASAAGIVIVGKNVSEAVEQLDKLSRASGVSVEALQVFREQIREAGGDPETLTTALRFLNRSIATSDPILKQLGITSKDTFTVFMQLARAFEGSADSAKKNEIAFQLLGRGAADLVGILPEIARGFSGMDSAMRQSGGLMTGEVLGAARDLDKQMDTLSRNWIGAITRIKVATVPWANDLVSAFDDMWNAIAHGGDKTLPEVERQIAGVESEIRQAIERSNKNQAEHPGSKLAQIYADEFNQQMTLLEGRLKKLNDLRAKLDPSGESIRVHQRDAGMPDDSLKGVVVGPQDEAAKKRAERLKEIEAAAKSLGMTATEAADALDRIEAGKKTADTIKALTLGPEVPKDWTTLQNRVQDVSNALGVDTDSARAFIDQLDKLSTTAKATDLRQALGIGSEKDWRSLQGRISDVAGALNVDTAAATEFVLQLQDLSKNVKNSDLRSIIGPDLMNDWTALQARLKAVANSLDMNAEKGSWAALQNQVEGAVDALNVDSAGRSWSDLHGQVDGVKAALQVDTVNAAWVDLKERIEDLASPLGADTAKVEALMQTFQDLTRAAKATDLGGVLTPDVAIDWAALQAQIEEVGAALKIDPANETWNALKSQVEGVKDAMNVEGTAAAWVDLKKRVEDVATSLGVDTSKAAEFMLQLGTLSKTAKGTDLSHALNLGASRDWKALQSRIADVAATLDVDTQSAEDFVAQLDEITKKAKAADLREALGIEFKKPLGPEVPKDFRTQFTVLQDWHKALTDIISLAGIVDDTFSSVFSSLEAGWSNVAMQIESGQATAGSIVKTIWHSVIDAVMQELARIAAVETIMGLANLLGIPSFGKLTGFMTSATQNSASPVAQLGMTGGGNTINVYGYDNHAIVTDLISPAGKLRQANDRLTFIGAY